MHILITRPKDVALTLAGKLKALGHHVLMDPLLKVTPTTPILPPLDAFQGVVTTSQQAIRCLADLTDQRDFLLWCVGKESEQVASQLGFQNIQSAGGSAARLLCALEKTIPVGSLPLLHASGDVIRLDLVRLLREKGIAAHRITLYKTEEATALSHETHQAILADTLDIILFYSPRTARIFQRLCQASHLQGKCVRITAGCLSPAIAQEIESLPWKDIRVAKQTITDDLLIALNLM
jgi:uroporphyrinogen-III synthase